MRVLGLQVDRQLKWIRDGTIEEPGEQRMTKRQIHQKIGSWLGHLPVNGWLRVSCAYIQRVLANQKIGWDEKSNEEITDCITEKWKKLKYEGDPAKGQWTVNANSPMNIWVDASSIALGVALEIDGDIVEDASWLRKQNDSQHINMSELDAAIKGINMTMKWGRRKMTLFTDSATVNGWLR